MRDHLQSIDRQFQSEMDVCLHVYMNFFFRAMKIILHCFRRRKTTNIAILKFTADAMHTVGSGYGHKCRECYLARQMAILIKQCIDSFKTKATSV